MPDQVELKGRVLPARQDVRPFYGWLTFGEDGLCVTAERARVAFTSKRQVVQTFPWRSLREIRIERKPPLLNAFGGEPIFGAMGAANTLIRVIHTDAEFGLECWTNNVDALRARLSPWTQRLIDQKDSSPRDSNALTERLRELAELHSSGALTDDEFAAAKHKLLQT